MARRDWLKVEGYDEILDTLEFSQPDEHPGYVAVRISEVQHLMGIEPFPALDVWLPPDQLPKLDGLRKLVQTGLGELRHPVSPALIDSLLPLIPLTPGVGREKLAYLFSQFRMTPVTQTLVFPFGYVENEDIAQISIGDFRLKPFDSSEKISAAIEAKSPLGTNSELEERPRQLVCRADSGVCTVLRCPEL